VSASPWHLLFAARRGDESWSLLRAKFTSVEQNLLRCTMRLLAFWVVLGAASFLSEERAWHPRLHRSKAWSDDGLAVSKLPPVEYSDSSPSFLQLESGSSAAPCSCTISPAAQAPATPVAQAEIEEVPDAPAAAMPMAQIQIQPAPPQYAAYPQAPVQNPAATVAMLQQQQQQLYQEQQQLQRQQQQQEQLMQQEQWAAQQPAAYAAPAYPGYGAPPQYAQAPGYALGPPYNPAYAPPQYPAGPPGYPGVALPQLYPPAYRQPVMQQPPPAYAPGYGYPPPMPAYPQQSWGPPMPGYR